METCDRPCFETGLTTKKPPSRSFGTEDESSRGTTSVRAFLADLLLMVCRHTPDAVSGAPVCPYAGKPCCRRMVRLPASGYSFQEAAPECIRFFPPCVLAPTVRSLEVSEKNLLVSFTALSIAESIIAQLLFFEKPLFKKGCASVSTPSRCSRVPALPGTRSSRRYRRNRRQKASGETVRAT